MALWTGYIALGNYSGGVFTELSGGNYARKAWSFDPTGIPGVIAGSDFTKADFGNGPFSYNAMAFFTASSGGSAMFVYPLIATAITAAGLSLTIHAANAWINVTTGAVRNGLTLVPLPAIALADFSKLQTADPGGGKPWLNGGVMQVGP